MCKQNNNIFAILSPETNNRFKISLSVNFKVEIMYSCMIALQVWYKATI